MVRVLQTNRSLTMFTTSFATALTAIATVGTLFFAGVCLIGATAPAAAHNH